MKPAHTLTFYFLKIHFNIILSSAHISEWTLPFRFSNQNFESISHLSMRAACPAHLILLDLATLIKFGEEYKLWISLSYSFLQPPVSPSLLDPNVLLSILFSNTLNLCSCFRDQVSLPYKTTGKIIVTYILDVISNIFLLMS
jgi:hypothetical protein